MSRKNKLLNWINTKTMTFLSLMPPRHIKLGNHGPLHEEHFTINARDKGSESESGFRQNESLPPREEYNHAAAESLCEDDSKNNLDLPIYSGNAYGLLDRPPHPDTISEIKARKVANYIIDQGRASDFGLYPESVEKGIPTNFINRREGNTHVDRTQTSEIIMNNLLKDPALLNQEYNNMNDAYEPPRIIDSGNSIDDLMKKQE